MFETSVVREGALRSRGRFSLLTISLIAHSAVIVGAVAISVASVEFPASAPDFMETLQFTEVQIPPKLGDPNGGAPPKPAVTPPPAQKVEQPTQPVAPTTVPDEVPALETPSTTTSSGGDTGGNNEGTVPGPKGVPWGDPDGFDVDGPPATNIVQPEPAKIYTVAEVNAPVLQHRVEPVYPPALVRAKLPGKAIVRCIIDKNGHVRDPQVVYSSVPAFGEATARAVTQWRYKPASLNGIAVDCYLDVVVTFGIK